MSFHRSPRLEKLLTLLLALPFFVPLPLTILVSSASDRAGLLGTLSRAILDGTPPFALPAPPLPLLPGLEDARYQKALTSSFNGGFAGRPWFIRLAGETYLRLFHSSPVGVVVGRRDSFFYNFPPYDFVNEYCAQRPPPDALRPLVDDLRRFRDNCLSRHVGFAIVITPSKASIYPGDLPLPWQWRHDPRPRAYDNFVRLLQAEKIRCIDGHLLTLDARKRAPAPVFPDTGTHWNQYASLVTANAILGELRQQGQPVGPVENSRTVVSDDPAGQDADMLGLVRTLPPPRKCRVSATSFPPFDVEEGRQPNLVLVGGSFFLTLGQQLFATREFSEVDLLYYYNQRKSVATEGGWQVLAENIAHVDVEREVFAAQCLVLEINEQQLVDPVHLRHFFADTIDRLPMPGSPRFRFRYATHLGCQWGESLLLAGLHALGNPLAFTGFSDEVADGRWTDGPDATIRLDLPAAGEDRILSVDASTLAVPGEASGVRATVFANGQRLAEWVYDGSEPQERTVVIPGALLASGALVLRFHLTGAAGTAAGGSALPPQPKPALLIRELVLR